MIVTANTSAATWRTWVGTTNSYTIANDATGGNIGTASTIWRTWVASTATTSAVISTGNDAVWHAWNLDNGTIGSSAITYATKAWVEWVADQELTAEQRAARARLHQEAQAREAERQRFISEQVAKENAIRRAADEKAEKLLKEHLSDEERARYERAGYFHVRSKKGNLYKVKKGTHGNVIRLDPVTSEELESLCVQPHGVPVADANLAQKLWIEHAEEEFRRIANIRTLPRRAGVA